MKTMTRMFASLVAVLATTPVLAQVSVDPELPEYKPTGAVSGTIKSVGSDTMNNMMTLWSEGFKRFYPNVKVEIEGKGSSTAPPALIEGTANFGPMSRAMKPTEIDAFEAKFGYKPIQLQTSIDMLAVYVHKDNPIKGLNLAQVDAIFSSTRKLGHTSDIRSWGEAGLTGAWANRPISLYGRNSASGTYGYFKEEALGKGDYKPTVKEQPGSSTVVQGVATDLAGVGYSGIGYKTADVRAVPLAIEGTEFVEAVPANAYTGDYPLARPLLLSVNYKPGSKLDPLRAEFLKYIFSKQGQQDVVKDGYFPIPASVANEMLEQVGLKSAATAAK
ncbi:MAG: PstS family phosphate ABC transporter substrate-binding protein [Planctomycetales bacterium]|nr:PstS family phosphate ABC transporter substrate-binding protein [Planctomycetales bacterium]